MVRELVQCLRNDLGLDLGDEDKIIGTVDSPMPEGLEAGDWGCQVQRINSTDGLRSVGLLLPLMVQRSL